MSLKLNSEEKRMETDVLVLGAGAAGCGAAMAAKTKGVRVQKPCFFNGIEW